MPTSLYRGGLATFGRPLLAQVPIDGACCLPAGSFWPPPPCGMIGYCSHGSAEGNTDRDLFIPAQAGLALCGRGLKYRYAVGHSCVLSSPRHSTRHMDFQDIAQTVLLNLFVTLLVMGLLAGARGVRKWAQGAVDWKPLVVEILAFCLLGCAGLGGTLLAVVMAFPVWSVWLVVGISLSIVGALGMGVSLLYDLRRPWQLRDWVETALIFCWILGGVIISIHQVHSDAQQALLSYEYRSGRTLVGAADQIFHRS